MSNLKRTTAPKRLLIAAAFLAGFFALCHVAGLREQTGMLSGTMPGSMLDLWLGLLYVASWFAFVLGAPILALGGGLQLAILAVAARVARRRPRAQTARSGRSQLSLPAGSPVEP